MELHDVSGVCSAPAPSLSGVVLMQEGSGYDHSPRGQQLRSGKATKA